MPGRGEVETRRQKQSSGKRGGRHTDRVVLYFVLNSQRKSILHVASEHRQEKEGGGEGVKKKFSSSPYTTNTRARDLLADKDN